MIDILHRQCGEVAFRYTEYPARGQAIDPAKARLLDGTTPVGGTMMVCGSCGQWMDAVDVYPSGGDPDWSDE